MILLVRDGSRWSINWTPSIVELMTAYLGDYNEAMFRIQAKIDTEKDRYTKTKYNMLMGDINRSFPLTEAQLHLDRRRFDISYGVQIRFSKPVFIISNDKA